MSFPKPSPEALAILKEKYGSVVLVQFGELGWFTLLCWGKDTYADYVDAATKDRANATQRFAARSTITPTPAEYAVARQRKPNLASAIVSTLCELAGIPGDGTKAETWEEPLTDKTPPASLERAGLAGDKVLDLLTQSDRDLTLVSVSDREGKVYFGGVLAAPTDIESGMLSDLKKRKKGLQDGMKSIVESCLVWSREPLSETVNRYPGIVSVLMEIIADKLEVTGTDIFRP